MVDIQALHGKARAGTFKRVFRKVWEWRFFIMIGILPFLERDHKPLYLGDRALRMYEGLLCLLLAQILIRLMLVRHQRYVKDRKNQERIDNEQLPGGRPDA